MALVAVLFNYISYKPKVLDFEFAENREITATSEAKAKSIKGTLYRIAHITKISHILETFRHIGYVCYKNLKLENKNIWPTGSFVFPTSSSLGNTLTLFSNPSSFIFISYSSCSNFPVFISPFHFLLSISHLRFPCCIYCFSFPVCTSIWQFQFFCFSLQLPV